MLKIRLQRVGRKNDPSFRIVVTESKRAPQSGNYIEMLGTHDPRKGNTQVKDDRVKYWISNGAQVSDTVHNILVNKKIIEGKKVNVLPKKQAIKSEEPEPEAKPEEVAEEKEEVKETPKEEPQKEESKEEAKEKEDKKEAK